MDELIKNDQKDIYVLAESSANSFVIRVMTIIAGLAIICFGLNELQVFRVPRVIMLVTMLVSFLIFITPLVIFVIHDKLLKKPNSICRHYSFKVIMVTFMYVGIALVGIALSFHAILLLVIPSLMIAQYRYSKKMSVYVFIAALLLVPATVYGSFFIGLPDRNFIKGGLSDEEMLDLAKRFALGTPRRLIEILFHYVFPRMLALICVNLLAIGISKRNAIMLDKQKELMAIAREEMEQKNNMQVHVIEDLAGIIESRDVGTGEHVIRTKKYVGLIARELQKYPKYRDQLTDREIDEIETAASLHDIGKIAIPDTILLKPGRFTPEEFDIMKKHSEKGGEMVNSIFVNLGDRAFLDKAYNIAVAHHERWDGTGYPKGLKGEEIPLSARIMAIADVYDALVSKRVYKDPMAPHDAFKILLEESGTHFDPNIIDIIKGMEKDFYDIATMPIEQAVYPNRRSA
ncbi:MAG: HD domain-containing protein [Clostridia bacterium]|nr:HD domain-containing protein [Clostridia bacterium]